MDPRANNQFDPQRVLMEQKQFAKQHGINLSPQPKRIITPKDSEEKNFQHRQGGADPNQYNDGQGQMAEADGEKELLIMTIEIGDGKKDTVRVFENDDPNELAKRFCEKHNLNHNIIYPLAQNIYTNMEQVLQERLEQLNYGNGEYLDSKGVPISDDDTRRTQQQNTGGFRNPDGESADRYYQYQQQQQ